jgi:hypothetical protein
LSTSELITEIAGLYSKHGWQLRRILLRAETRSQIGSPAPEFASVPLEEAMVDALWFSRPSHGTREAWELRLIAENPYAFFETFEMDESEEQREEMRREMEARLRDYVTK